MLHNLIEELNLTGYSDKNQTIEKKTRLVTLFSALLIKKKLAKDILGIMGGLARL
jgi:hypothetical protein